MKNTTKKFNTDNELLEELVSIVKSYDSSKGEENISIDEISAMIENHNFQYDFGYTTALEILNNYKEMRSILDPIGEMLKGCFN